MLRNHCEQNNNTTNLFISKSKNVNLVKLIRAVLYKKMSHCRATKSILRKKNFVMPFFVYCPPYTKANDIKYETF